MISDTDRRAVARRLRGIKDTREGCEHDMCCDLWSAIFDSDYRCTGLCDECEVAVLDSLADLIEPSCDRDTPQKVAEEMFGKMRHSTKEEADAYDAMLKSKSVEIHPVDRDALLALADEMDRDGRVQRERQKACEHWFIDGLDVMEYARRIREALGVVE